MKHWKVGYIYGYGGIRDIRHTVIASNIVPTPEARLASILEIERINDEDWVNRFDRGTLAYKNNGVTIDVGRCSLILPSRILHVLYRDGQLTVKAEDHAILIAWASRDEFSHLLILLSRLGFIVRWTNGNESGWELDDD